MRIRVGTSGYSYKEWKGPFYPERLPAKAFLKFYASKLDTVEINNSFYRLPTEKTLGEWAAEVPDAFSFSLKASQYLTHKLRLKDASEAVTRFWGLREKLGGKRGPVLVQLPPFVKKDAPLLREFLALLPAGHMAALEFRHASWFDDEVYDALRAKGATLVLSETDESTEEQAKIVATADFAYLRLRRVAYDDAQIAAWADQIRAQPWKDAYVFFKHEDAGTGPRLAAKLVARLA